MSFTGIVKSEISKLETIEAENISELSAIIKNIGIITDYIKITTENASVARRIFKLLKETFFISPKIIVRKGYNFNKNYIYILLIFYIIKQYIYKNGVEQFLKIINIGVFNSSVIIFLIKLIGNEESLGLLDWENRFTFGFQTLYMITIPLSIYKLSKTDRDKKLKIADCLVILLEGYLAIVSQNRAYVIIVIINILIAVVIIGVQAIKSRNILKLMNSMVICICTIMIFLGVVYIAINMDLGIVDRFTEIISGKSIGNLDTRQVTNNNTVKLIKESIFGYGIGSRMSMLSPYGEIYSIPRYTDNGILSIVYRFGIMSSILMLILFIFYIFRITKSSKYVTLLIFELTIIAGMITSQILHNNAVVITYLGLLCCHFMLRKDMKFIKK